MQLTIKSTFQLKHMQFQLCYNPPMTKESTNRDNLNRWLNLSEKEKADLREYFGLEEPIPDEE